MSVECRRREDLLRPTSRRVGSDDTIALRSLLGRCEDDADSTLRLAHLLNQDNDSDTARVFHAVSVEREEVGDLIVALLEDHGAEAVKARRPVRSRLFRLRLWIAERIPVGYGAEDDRRFLLRLATRGFDLTAEAYAEVQALRLSPQVREEVHRQAQHLESARRRIHQVSAGLSSAESAGS